MDATPTPWKRARLLLGSVSLLAAACTPSIGDKCVLSTDCSFNGDRVCDTSQPDGYCTVIGCTPDTCPDTAACVLFEAAVPGCAYGDRAPSRTGRSYCLARCTSPSDCRDGYVCADPRVAPWNGVILDDDQGQHACMVAPSGPVQPLAVVDAAVCQTSGPPVPPIDAGVRAPLDAGDDDADAPTD